MRNNSHAAVAALASALALFGCGIAHHSAPTTTQAASGGHTSAPTAASAPAHESPANAVITARPGSVPVLHPGMAATVSDFSSVGDNGAGVPETQVWKLTSVTYITHAEALQGGQYDDLASQLGTTEPQPGDRYLVLGLTVNYKDRAQGNDNFTLNNATVNSVRPGGQVTQTSLDCASRSSTGLAARYSAGADFCGLNSMNAGQSATGYAIFEVPDPPSVLVFTSSDQAATPLLVIDPDRLISASTCTTTGSTC